ncbi:hypothetical protein DFH09DRAFT_1498702 [Mycena vulgaris]|nr:hypothetical protein DFH09DRAFT_1498702 [Mycena vulgaris]
MDPAYRDLVLETIRQLESDLRPEDLDMANSHFMCRRCMVACHVQIPLHRIEMWSGTSLVGATLQALGMRIKLGHSLGEVCTRPIPDDEFIMLNAHGVHNVSLDYCGCPDAREREAQLRAARFYPDQTTLPRNAVAFELAHMAAGWVKPGSMRLFTTMPMDPPASQAATRVRRKRKASNELVNLHAPPLPTVMSTIPAVRPPSPPPPLSPPDNSEWDWPATLLGVLIDRKDPEITMERSGVPMDLGYTDGELPERGWVDYIVCDRTNPVEEERVWDPIHRTLWPSYDGYTPECAWANAHPLQGSTTYMGVAERQPFLGDARREMGALFLKPRRKLKLFDDLVEIGTAPTHTHSMSAEIEALGKVAEELATQVDIKGVTILNSRY